CARGDSGWPPHYFDYW
nr:immunoglobulin heavy chain junction region [Macaca mulatta]MOV49757.1 immunoglobulin heavy chain junction region [Macaca mulatta]MOV50363.1 immunoglobulin heavy chain junction region [Macaca mulatta]MOV50430.1 immunoglobulin heavy chain junction region [Macaca mulatta]MOV50720.1 immunoglobulin heavy chain junction region [Macaca mulatta]